MNNRKIHPNAIWLLNKTFKFVALVVVVAACLANGCLAASLKRGNIGKSSFSYFFYVFSASRIIL